VRKADKVRIVLHPRRMLDPFAIHKSVLPRDKRDPESCRGNDAVCRLRNVRGSDEGIHPVEISLGLCVNRVIDGQNVGVKLVRWVVASMPLEPSVPGVEEILVYHFAKFKREPLEVVDCRL
jgi:hypothetical protein